MDDFLRQILDSSYDGIHVLDRDGNTLFINAACARIEGIYEEDVRGKNIRQLVEEGYFSESVTLKVLDSKAPVTMIQKVKNGNEVLITGTPLFSGGEVDKVIINSRDITELNLLRRELSKKDRLVEKYHQELQLYALSEDDIVFSSNAMQKVANLAVTIAKVDSTVLITGESGTGKGVIAKLIHENSRRKDKPFIKIDCASIPGTLFESELYGYEKGAFTGASSQGKTGLAELANGGTLFLDEIGEIPPELQVKMLTMIQDKTIYKVGDPRPLHIDVRFIAATNRNLEELMGQNLFRRDLFYRLNVVPVIIPPLRERPEDLQALILSNIRKLNEKYRLTKTISLEAMELLIGYEWPGNTRELENLIERVMVTSPEDRIGSEDLPESIQSRKKVLHTGEISSLRKQLDDYESQILETLLAEGAGTAEIAQRLKIDPSNVRRKLDKHGLR